MDKIQSLKFLNDFFFRLFPGQEFFVEFRFIRGGRPPIPRFLWSGELSEEDLSKIEHLNAEHNIYFGVCPRPNNKASKDTDITTTFSLWADIDGKDYDQEDWEKGKAEARKEISKFRPGPSFIIDSGHGWQCYWMLKEPLDIGTDEKKIELRQILSGIVRSLKGDRHRINPSSMMRLPGTTNVKHLDNPDKYPGPAECKIDAFFPENVWNFADFARYKDSACKILPPAEEVPLNFGKRKLVVSQDSQEAAEADVNKLEVESPVKRRIITGSLRTEPRVNQSRSGRDFWIERQLIRSDYDYDTLRSIFFNPYLGCSLRIIEQGEATFRYEVQKAWLWVQDEHREHSPQWQKILSIKKRKGIHSEERRVKINQYVISDLFSGEEAAGRGYNNRERRAYYFFEKNRRVLMNIEETDFYLYIRHRFGIGRRDFDEIKDAVMTEIGQNGEEVEPQKLSFFDQETQILYVSDHDNGIYRLDGDSIEYLPNGTDGVFFEYNTKYTPFVVDMDKKQEVIDYFVIERQVAEIRIKRGCTLGGRKVRRMGFNPERFRQSLLYRYVIEKANLVEQTESGLSPEDQRNLLAVYFYSVYFGSLMAEKPIICFVGHKESGKSTIATLIGKVLFGPRFESRHSPDNVENLKTILGANTYLVFDNVDHFVKSEIIDTLCVASTGGAVEKRKLYTDHDIVRFRPNVFLAITTREGRFRRDDLVSRLLMFITRKVDHPVSRSGLFRDIEEHRNIIMTEVLVNLNSAVKILRIFRAERPQCVSRIADWEAFCRKIYRGIPWGPYFIGLMETMNTEKGRFSLEDDYLYVILKQIVIENEQKIEDESAMELYSRLKHQAKQMGLKDFDKRYKSPGSIGKRLANIKEELNEVMVFDVATGRANKKLYSFRSLNKVTEKAEVDTMTTS